MFYELSSPVRQPSYQNSMEQLVMAKSVPCNVSIDDDYWSAAYGFLPTPPTTPEKSSSSVTQDYLSQRGYYDPAMRDLEGVTALAAVPMPLGAGVGSGLKSSMACLPVESCFSGQGKPSKVAIQHEAGAWRTGGSNHNSSGHSDAQGFTDMQENCLFPTSANDLDYAQKQTALNSACYRAMQDASTQLASPSSRLASQRYAPYPKSSGEVQARQTPSAGNSLTCGINYQQLSCMLRAENVNPFSPVQGYPNIGQDMTMHLGQQSRGMMQQGYGVASNRGYSSTNSLQNSGVGIKRALDFTETGTANYGTTMSCSRMVRRLQPDLAPLQPASESHSPAVNYTYPMCNPDAVAATAPLSKVDFKPVGTHPAWGQTQTSISEPDEAEVSRATHNVLERQRRNDLKTRLQRLRENIPELAQNEKAPKIVVLRKAYEHIRELQKHEQRLSNEHGLAKQRRAYLLHVYQQMGFY